MLSVPRYCRSHRFCTTWAESEHVLSKHPFLVPLALQWVSEEISFPNSLEKPWTWEQPQVALDSVLLYYYKGTCIACLSEVCHFLPSELWSIVWEYQDRILDDLTLQFLWHMVYASSTIIYLKNQPTMPRNQYWLSSQTCHALFPRAEEIQRIVLGRQEFELHKLQEFLGDILVFVPYQGASCHQPLDIPHYKRLIQSTVESLFFAIGKNARVLFPVSFVSLTGPKHPDLFC